MDRQITYTNAGHNAPFVVRTDGRVLKLEDRHGPVSGAVEEVAYKSSTVDLGRGDRVVLYTDGVSEAMDVDHRQFTEEALETLLGAAQAHSPRTSWSR